MNPSASDPPPDRGADIRRPPPLPPEAVAAYAEAQDFFQALLLHTPRAWVTPTLIALNVLVWLAMVFTGVHPQAPTSNDLIRWGANFGPLTGGGQWWRLLTCTFVHIGLVHLAFNMYALWGAGPLVERLLGNTGFAVTYLLSGLFGSLASYWWNPDRISAGASGAVFGIFGALLGFLVRGKESIPMGVLANLRSSGLAFMGYNLVLAFMIPHIDQAAHLGGAAAGFLCGVVLSHHVTPAGVRGRPLRNLFLAGAGGLLLAAGIAAMPSALVNVRIDEDMVWKLDQAAQDAYDAAVEQVKQNRLPEREVAGLIERQVLPAYRRAGAQLASLKDLPPRQEQRVTQLKELIRLREEAFKVLAQALRENDQNKAEQWKEKWDASERLAQKLRPPNRR